MKSRLPKKKLRISSHTPGKMSQVDNDDVDLPLLLNDYEYRMPEAVKILASYKKGSKEIGLAMRARIKLKYVPVCLCSLHCLVERANNGEPVLDTDLISASRGHLPIASLNEVKVIAEKMEDQSGRIVSQEDVAKLL